ncbi:MAG: hypothetical protein V1911_01870 [Candidatus Micrarchaeota archaeon]
MRLHDLLRRKKVRIISKRTEPTSVGPSENLAGKVRIVGTRPLQRERRGKVTISEPFGAAPQKFRAEELRIKEIEADKLKLASFERRADKTKNEIEAVGILLKQGEGKFVLIDLRDIEGLESSLSHVRTDKEKAYQIMSDMLSKAKSEHPGADFRILIHHSHPVGFDRTSSTDVSHRLVHVTAEKLVEYGEPVIGVYERGTGRHHFFEGDRRIEKKIK